MFNLQDYEDVAARIKRFHETYNSGRIVVDVISHDFKEGIILVEASVYRYAEDTLPAATDIALGIRDTFNVSMRKFYAEDTSTSAIGRAIGLLLGSDKRPTKQDMGRVETTRPTVKESQPDDDLWQVETYTSINNEQTKEPQAGLDAKALIESKLGGEEVETCQHGTRLLKQGTSKAGKPYKGYVCGVTVPGAQCKPIWYTLSPTGAFIRPKEAGDL